MRERLEIHCGTGAVQRVPLTAEEEAARDAEEAAAQAARAQQQADAADAAQQRAADVAVILDAMPTPESRAALRRFLGVPDAG
jgi:hypothetical protein